MMPPRTYYLENRTPYAGELDTRDGVEVKFVGGPLDGTTRHVPPDAREWRVTGESYRVYTRVNAYTFQFVSVQTHHMCEHNRGYTVEALLEEHNEWTKRQSRA